MIKKFLTLSFVIALFLVSSPLSLAHEYRDVPNDSPYYYPVHYLRRNDVFKNTPNFYPETIISKAEFIKYLVILNNPNFRTGGRVELPFEDTRNNAWYASYFKEAIKLGILDSRTLRAEPDKKLTVVDALTLLFHSQSIPIPNVYKGGIPYTDVARNTKASPLVMRALQLDIISPQRNNFVGIYQRVTRAQAARMIYKMDLVTLGTPASNGLPQTASYGPEMDKIINAWELIDRFYLESDKLDKNKMADEVLKFMTQHLDDPYSVYMNTRENRNFLDSLDGEIEGIGAVIGFNEENRLSVVSPLKDSPAMKAGLKPKDVILEVDGHDMTGITLEDAVALIKGPRGTPVKLKISRGGSVQFVTIIRELIEIPSVEYEIIDGGSIMHLMTYQFNHSTNAEFSEAISQITANPSVKGLILDLRGNPGGLLEEAIRMLGYFVEPQKELLSINYADYSRILLSRGEAQLNSFPTIVLIDVGSASASEIVAGALQDYGLAKIMGENSFGKGTVQEVNYFQDNSSLKLTVAKWLTPLRQDIQDGGISPDISIKDNPDTEVDEVLQKAIAELKKMTR